MTKAEAISWVKSHDDDCTIDNKELEEAFTALYEREPDDQDRLEGLWNHCCAYVF